MKQISITPATAVIGLYYSILCISNVLFCYYVSDTEAFDAWLRFLHMMDAIFFRFWYVR